MTNECPNCKKQYIHTEDDFARLFNGGHIRVTCKCPKGIDILVGGKKMPKIIDAFGAAMDLEIIKTRSQKGLKIVEEENPPVRTTTKRINK